MDEADYWLRQILMYWGFPNTLFTEDEAPRDALDEKIELKVLQLADEATLGEIYASLLRLPARWTPGQWDEVSMLAPRMHALVPASTTPFKENLIRLSVLLMELGHAPDLSTATDVLRLASAMSEGDVSLRENTKLRTFKRRERRALLGMLESATRLDEDAARRRERFKRLFRALRPGDWATRFPRCVAIYDLLYRGATIETYEVKLERLIAAKEPAVLTLLAERPACTCAGYTTCCCSSAPMLLVGSRRCSRSSRRRSCSRRSVISKAITSVHRVCSLHAATGRRCRFAGKTLRG